jgi:cell division protein FtsB
MHIRTRKKKSFGRYSLQILSALVLVVVFVMGSALARELYREYQIKKEIDSLKGQIASMQKDNYELSQFLDYYQTDQYKESEARKRLNLKADGEKVVMIDGSQAEVEEKQKAAAAEQASRLPTYQKWWNYFFATRMDAQPVAEEED